MPIPVIAGGTLLAWLLLIIWPLVKKVLVSLGIGVLTYAGLSLIANQVQDQVMALWGAVGGNCCKWPLCSVYRNRWASYWVL
jgi:hypothetical protein